MEEREREKDRGKNYEVWECIICNKYNEVVCKFSQLSFRLDF